MAVVVVGKKERWVKNEEENYSRDTHATHLGVIDFNLSGGRLLLLLSARRRRIVLPAAAARIHNTHCGRLLPVNAVSGDPLKVTGNWISAGILFVCLFIGLFEFLELKSMHLG